MNSHGSETIKIPALANMVQDGSLPSPTALSPSLRISEMESDPSAQTPYHKLHFSESHENRADGTQLQEPIQPEKIASNSNEGLDPLPEAPHFVSSSETQHEKWSTRKSLGWGNLGVIIGGTIASCAIVGFLIFLWTGQGRTLDGEHASSAWRSIMFSGWLPQLITLSSVILRFSIGAQTTICTSLVAALVLERRSIARSRVAPISILRSVNSTPRILIQQIWGEKHSRHLLLRPEGFLILLLALGNIAMQFSSTILFSDLQARLLVRFPREIQTGLLQSNGSAAVVVGWPMPPHDFSLFGELYTGYSADPNSLGLSDTGVKRHAMLPFSKSEERTALRSYRGPSLVLSSRVACMPPTVSGEVRFTNSTPSSSSAVDQSYGYMAGKILYEDTFRRAGIIPQDTCNSEKCLSDDIHFNCGVPSSYGDRYGDRSGEGYEPIVNSFCVPIGVDEELVSSPWHIDQDPWTTAATVVLVFSTNFDDSVWASLGNTPVELPQSNVQEEWRSFNFGSDRFIDMTVCFKSMNVMLPNVSLSTEEDLIEPNMGHNATTADTASLRRFYGAEPEIQNLTERGVFTIQEIQDRDDFVYGARDPGQVPLYQQTTSGIEYADNYIYPNTTLPGCTLCAGDYSSTAREYSSIFSDIITTTHRASVALQTVHTMLVQSIHDQLIAYFAVLLPVQIVDTVTATVPVRCIGLSVVTILTLVNLICIVMITTLYLVYSRYTLVDNFWHVISQTVSDATADILEHSNRSKDRDAADQLKTKDYLVRLQNLEETGEIKIVKAHSNSDAPLILQWYRRSVQAVGGKKQVDLRHLRTHTAEE